MYLFRQTEAEELVARRIVDFHTHVFPDRVAQRAIGSIGSACGIPPHTDGTLGGLRAQLSEAGVTVAVNLPVVTNPEQFDSIVHFAEAINADFDGTGVLSFAGMHPAMTDIEAKIRLLCDKDFRGIKLHPDYQNTFFDDDGYYAILKAAKDHGLTVVTHAGLDGAHRGKVIRCTPERVARMLDRLGGYDRLVLAHFAGHTLYDEVGAHLVGRDVYLDTSMVMEYLGKERALSLIARHGAHRVLFATDSPWQPIRPYLDAFLALGLDVAAEEKILWGNAAALLGL